MHPGARGRSSTTSHASTGRARSPRSLPLGLRPRHLIALTVLRDHGGMTQQALAAALQVDRTNLVGLLNELEDDGLIGPHAIDRGPQAPPRRADRRRARRLGQAETALAAVEDQVLGALDHDQRVALYDAPAAGHRRPRRRLRRRRGRPGC